MPTRLLRRLALIAPLLAMLALGLAGPARAAQDTSGASLTIDATLEGELRTLRIARNQADYDDHLPSEHFQQLLPAVTASSAWILSCVAGPGGRPGRAVPPRRPGRVDEASARL